MPVHTGRRTPPPVNVVPASIAGTMLLGNVLTATPGTWTGLGAVSGQWRRDGVLLGGQTGLTLTLDQDTYFATQGSETNPVIDYLETAQNSGGTVTEPSSNSKQFSEVTALGALFKLWIRGSGLVLGAPPAIASVTDASPAANNLAQAVVGSRPTRVVNDVGLFAARFVLGSGQFFNGAVLSALIANGAGVGTAFWSLSARKPIDSNADAALALGYNLPGQGVGRAGGYVWLQSLGKTGGGQLYIQTGAYSTAAAAGKGAQGNVATSAKTLVQGWLDASNKQIHLRLGWGAQIDGDIMADTIASVTDPTVWGAAAPGGNFVTEDLSEMLVCTSRPSAQVEDTIRAAVGVRQGISSAVTYTPLLNQIWNNGWNSPQAYGRFVAGGARFVFETNSDSIVLQAYSNSPSIDPVYGAIAVWRGAPGDINSSTLVTTVAPPASVGMVNTTIALGGVPGSTRRVFVDAGALSGFIGYQPQNIVVDVSKTFTWISQPANKTVAFEGWGSRLNGGDAVTYDLGDGYVVSGGVIIDGPGNIYLNKRTDYQQRIARYAARWWVLRLGTNDGQNGTSAADYQIALEARIADIQTFSGVQLQNVIVSAPVRRTTILGGSTLPSWWLSYQAAAAAAVAAVGGNALFHDSTNDWQFSDLSVIDGLHGLDATAEGVLAASVLATIPDQLGVLVYDGDSIMQGSANPAIVAMAYALPPQTRVTRAL